METTGTKIRSLVRFEVGGDVPHRALTDATERALDAARASVAARGEVEATGALGSVAHGSRVVRIALAIRIAAGAAPTIAVQAERAFADAFVARLDAQGYVASRASADPS